MALSLSPEERELIVGNPLFAGLDPQELEEALACLQATRRQVDRGGIIQRVGEPFRFAGIVLTGQLECSFATETYNHVSLLHFSAGEVFGEILAWTGAQRSPMQVRALADSEILLLNWENLKLRADGLGPLEGKLLRNLVDVTAARTVYLNRRVRVLSQGNIRDRLRVFLAESPADDAGFVRLPFSYAGLAQYLGVNRSALSREMGKMRTEGLLETAGNALRLKE